MTGQQSREGASWLRSDALGITWCREVEVGGGARTPGQRRLMSATQRQDEVGDGKTNKTGETVRADSDHRLAGVDLK